MDKVLVTGAAGFIGFHIAQRLCRDNPRATIFGIDNLNDYYDPSLKESRLRILESQPNFQFFRMDFSDRVAVADFFSKHEPDIVLHVGAQAGVRYSIENPHAYTESNITGFLNILEGCRTSRVKHLIFASSSSVYGLNEKIPFSAHDNVDHPISLYAATKKSNELMAHTYSYLYDIPCTGLRFFTVYGPYGRPDMAYFKFTKAIFERTPIDVYNNGQMQRDFTYIDDIVEAIMRLIPLPAESNKNWSGTTPDPCTSPAKYRIYNIGNNKPENLMDMIGILEKIIGKEAWKKMMPMQMGDVHSTYADIDDLHTATGFKPSTSIETGLKNFVEWYRSYYKV